MATCPQRTNFQVFLAYFTGTCPFSRLMVDRDPTYYSNATNRSFLVDSVCPDQQIVVKCMLATALVH